MPLTLFKDTKMAAEKKPIKRTLKTRCFWANKDILLRKYHDTEWGIPVHDDKKHFEMLVLEGAQAGVNWLTILRKREGYSRLFRNFDPSQIAKMTDAELDECLKDSSIIRNKLKVYAVRKNARVFLNIQKEFGSFDDYIWPFVSGFPVVNQFETAANVPSQTEQSDEISKDLKKRGMSFVGPKVIYAYMQAIGMVNDHLVSCWRYRK